MTHVRIRNQQTGRIVAELTDDGTLIRHEARPVAAPTPSGADDLSSPDPTIAPDGTRRDAPDSRPSSSR